MRLGHAAANMRPASARGFFQQEYAEGRAVYFSAPATVAFIRIGGISLAVAVPVPESGIMRIQITPQVQRRTTLITVREKPVLMTPARSILAALLAVVGLPRSPASASAEPFTGAQEYEDFYHGLDEVNLLEELSAAPSSSNTLRPIAFPSTQIGAKIHKQDFALLASPPSAIDICSTTPTPATHATLCKSSRCIPFDVPCFHLFPLHLSAHEQYNFFALPH
ncbi:hypothetical protein EDB86DRAFT_3077051 [Lactarius hatsudake]|nr:hypothetical protein EDB86DRAFT_3077051 [Lactarius hatsudake]